MSDENEIQRIVHLYDNINDKASWLEFDRACANAEDNEGLRSDIEQIRWLRIEGFIDWEMAWREREALANPKGFYGEMRKRRLAKEEVIRRSEHASSN